MLYFQYALIGFVISFLGSVPVGLITLTIMARTVNRGKLAGILVGLGATIAEFVYPFTALKFLGFFITEGQIGSYIKLFSIFVFLGLGFYYFFKTRGPVFQEETRTAKHFYQDFGRGVVIGFTNLLIIPFYIVIGTMLEGYNMSFAEDILNVVFSGAAALGALAVFFLYVRMVALLVNRMEKVVAYTNKIVGTLFWGLTVFQSISLFAA